MTELSTPKDNTAAQREEARLRKIVESGKFPADRVEANSIAIRLLDAAAKTGVQATKDSFQNFALQLGMGTDNAQSFSTYGFNPITRERTLLEWIHRGSWLGGVAIDLVADDMTRAGIAITSKMEPDDIQRLTTAAIRWGVWPAISDVIRWSRLYGGALGVILIDGADISSPLDVKKVAKGAFRGMLVLDRWMVEPSLQELITDVGPKMGMPKYYTVTAYGPGLANQKIHHSRCLRMEGIRLPHWQRVMENYWGESVLERLYDRLVAFDSATTGASQLVYKSYLRTLKIMGFKELVSAGGDALLGVSKYVDMMRKFQGIEGVTLIDGNDEFDVQEHASFAGISDALLQFGQQLSGALQIPLVRLFGQSPAGLSSTGESDLRTYYDGIKQRQEHDLRTTVTDIYTVMAVSEGVQLPDDFWFEFTTLLQLGEQEKASTGATVTGATLDAFERGVVRKSTALKQLRGASRVTGMWTDITDEEIDEADDEPPVPQMGLPGEQPPAPKLGDPDVEEDPQLTGSDPDEKRDRSEPQRPLRLIHARDEGCNIDFQGLPIYIETPAGAIRKGTSSDGKPWEVVMPVDYGFIRQTGSAEGKAEGMDCFVGGDADAPRAWLIDQCDPDTGEFDEHKIMLGFRRRSDALGTYARSFSDRKGHARIGGVSAMSIDDLKSRLDRVWAA